MDYLPYQIQTNIWPNEGRHILAQFDDDTIIVYQAYSREIGEFAVRNGFFGNGFSYSRMSWIKPNFLWMMYRSGWGVKPNQEVTLGLRISRAFFESLLSEAVASTWNRDLFATEEDWGQAVERSSVRLQWDPDHHPNGAKLERRAIQLGLRGPTLKEFGRRQLLEVIDLTDFVTEQRERISAGEDGLLVTPKERVYTVSNPEIAKRLRLADWPVRDSDPRHVAKGE